MKQATEKMVPVFPTSYLPSIEYFRLLIPFEKVAFDQWENFPKQTNRNRCFILSPNGIQCLSIPIIHETGKKQAVKDLKISYASPWQRLHWRSFLTAYNRSPFFEFYSDELHHFYSDSHHKWLLDFNMDQFSWVLKIIKKNVVIEKTETFSPTETDVLRNLRFAKSSEPVMDQQFKSYNQVFGYKFGFTQNLSIIDLIFNMGGRSIDYLADSLN